jgi:hypothetical protein
MGRARRRQRRQLAQPASYSLIRVKRAAIIGLWLAGLNGAALVVAFAFMIQSYTSSRGDCETRMFVSDTLGQALFFARIFAVLAIFALGAAGLPTVVGIVRNYRRRQRDQLLLPLQPGQEFDGWSEGRVGWVAAIQIGLFLLLVGIVFPVVVVSPLAISAKPDILQQQWEKYEQACHWVGTT